MIADDHASENLRSRADIDAPSDPRQPWTGAKADRDLLENETIRAYRRLGVDDNAIGMSEQ